MNILVVSDTHGAIDRAEEMYRRLSEGMTVDALIHCGDHYTDALKLGERLGLPVTCVHGNCDGQMTREVQVLETPAGRIAVTHGHTENVKWHLQNLCYLAEEYDCRCVCAGERDRGGHSPAESREPDESTGREQTFLRLDCGDGKNPDRHHCELLELPESGRVRRSGTNELFGQLSPLAGKRRGG